MSVSSRCFPEGIAIGGHLVLNSMSTEGKTVCNANANELQEVEDCVVFPCFGQRFLWL